MKEKHLCLDKGAFFELFVGEVSEVGDGKDDAAKHPSGRIAQDDWENGVADEVCHDKQVDLSEDDETENHDQHWRRGLSSTSEGSRIDLVEGCCDVERGDVVKHHGAVVDDTGLVGIDEDLHDVCGKELDKENQDGNAGQCHEDGCSDSLSCSFGLSHSEVLADKSLGAKGDGLGWHEQELVNLGVGCVTSHDIGTKVVDVGLCEYVGKRCDGQLKAGRDSDFEDVLQNMGVDADLSDADSDAGLCAKKGNDHQDSGHALGDDGCQSDTRRSHVEGNDEDQIQNDVQYSGNDKEDERVGGVSDGAENGSSHVVDEKSCDSCKIDE